MHPEAGATREITVAEYEALKEFAENPDANGFNMQYNVIENSCVDFVWKALEAAGLNKSEYQGTLRPALNIQEFKNLKNGQTPPGFVYASGDPFTGLPWAGEWGKGTGAEGGIGLLGALRAAAAAAPQRRDPLALDLDGDGIETSRPEGDSVVLFDHNADGVRTGTGWLMPDDGWLVLDRNGNGSIDSGRELFGEDTLKSNGQLATDGFDALRDLDANRDGKMDAADSVFSRLRIWRDLNRDGISQATELRTLTNENIIAIALGATTVSTPLGNGNVLAAVGSFTRADGASGTSGLTSGTVANLDLVANCFHSQFTDAIPFTEQAWLTPNLRGSGQVRDLGEAISLSPDLSDWVAQYAVQSSRELQVAMLDGLIEKWADTSSFVPLREQAAALADAGVSVTYQLDGMLAGSAAAESFLSKLGVVERFMGLTFGGRFGPSRTAPLTSGVGTLTISLTTQQIADITSAYDSFKTNIYEALLPVTRLQAYTTLLFQGDGFSAIESAFSDAIAADARTGILDLIEFISAVGEARLADSGWASMGFLLDHLNATTANLGPHTAELSSWKVQIAALNETRLAGSLRSDLLVGGAQGETLYGVQGDDVLLGRGGNDMLYGEDGADVLHGGTGNDTLSGGGQNDMVLFGRGDGQDLLVSDYDTAASKLNVLQFQEDITVEDIIATRSGVDLILTVTRSTDRMTVSQFFYADDPGNAYNPIQQVRFADGTTWDAGMLAARALRGTAASDNFAGTTGNDTLAGQEGADWLYGRGGNDLLLGGADNDQLYGEQGNDTLDGGAGNDQLHGSTGNDTYLFGRGDGQDVINLDTDFSTGKVNTLQFKAGITADDILVQAYGEGLMLTIAGSTDRIVANGFFREYNPANLANPLQEIRFDDGTRWDLATITSKAFAGTAGADVINGSINADLLSGQAGNDSLNGREGEDTLAGGAGNDTLSGGAHDDVYLVGRGDGQDLIVTDYDTAAGKRNVLQFSADIAPDDVVGLRSGNDLVLTVAGTTDRITISYFFYVDNPGNAYNPIQQARFADGTVWDTGMLAGRALLGTAVADNLAGTTGNDTMAGQAGADWLYGRDGDDVLMGGADNDQLWGEQGNDRLDGGAGNDQLHGGRGNDTYLFGRGDGQDVINLDSDFNTGKINTLQFKAGITANDILVQAYGEGLMLTIAGSSDRIIANGFFREYNPANLANPLQEIRFDDGTRWDLATITSKAFAGTAGADSINGTSNADLLSGQAGNDSLNGREGEDVLDGGAGNDTLSGGAHNDVYRFGRGDGQDLIVTDYDTSGTRLNTLQFRPGIAPDDVVGIRSGNDLVLNVAGTTDRITISYFFYADNPGNPYNPIQQARFADGTVWDIGMLAGRALLGTAVADNLAGTTGNDTMAGQAGADWLYGRDGDDVLMGGADNDLLWGEQGNDRLDGGAGNDLLYGGRGNDTYLFGRGDGQDVINDADGERDRLILGPGISPDQVWFRAIGDDLELSLIGTPDKAVIRQWLATANKIEEISTFEGETLVADQLGTLMQAMGTFSPLLIGQTSLPPQYQAALAPVIASSWQ